LVARLSELGFECSSGSACTTGSLEPSHVLLACGFGSETALSSLRITLGQRTTKSDLEGFVAALKSAILTT
jgi:cysteine desulfurase